MTTLDNSIAVRDVTVDYQTRTGMLRALACDRLDVAGGTSLAVMGPSGCGKSTLLGLVAGLTVPTTGTVTIGAAMISAMAERDRVRFRRRALGMVYQADNLLPHLTVEENVGLQLAICRAETSTERADPAVVLQRLGIGDLGGRMPDQLSGGQRQRASLARAVIHRPAVILADEPTGALDHQSAVAAIELLVEVQKEIGATLMMVTHDPEMATHVDRVVQLAKPADHESEMTHAG